MKQENYLEGIYGCLERIEKKVETLPVEGTSPAVGNRTSSPEGIAELKIRLERRDARFHMGKQCVYVPYQMAVLLLYAIRETVDFLCFDFSVLAPADDVPPGGCANVNGKVVFSHAFFHSY